MLGEGRGEKAAWCLEMVWSGIDSPRVPQPPDAFGGEDCLICFLGREKGKRKSQRMYE